MVDAVLVRFGRRSGRGCRGRCRWKGGRDPWITRTAAFTIEGGCRITGVLGVYASRGVARVHQGPVCLSEWPHGYGRSVKGCLERKAQRIIVEVDPACHVGMA